MFWAVPTAAPAKNNSPAADFHLRACFENISVGLAAGRGGCNPFPDLFSKHALTGNKNLFVINSSIQDCRNYTKSLHWVKRPFARPPMNRLHFAGSKLNSQP